MPRKQYLSDFQAVAEQTQIVGILNIRPSDESGQFHFDLQLERDGPSYEITVLVSDISDYPTEHAYYLMGEDSMPKHMAATFERLSLSHAGQTLKELLQSMSDTLRSLDLEGDTPMPDSQPEDYEDYEDGEDDDSIDDFDEAAFDTVPTKVSSHSSTTAIVPATPRFQSRIRADLMLAKSAGFKIGCHGGLLDGLSCYVSVSCRIAKLGVSEEAMQAWQVNANDYLILVMFFPNGYRSVEDLRMMDTVQQRRSVKFSVGISHSNYKPTLDEAVKAFNPVSVEDQAKEEAARASQGQSAFRGFESCFISRPLNQLLNDRLLRLVFYREVGLSWSGAEQFYNDHQGMQYGFSEEVADDKYMYPEPDSTAYPALVTQDHIGDTRRMRDVSFPLAAMQFLLRHFVRCTEFCLVCHCKLDTDLEAIKPYVCEKPLCLYQYMSLGFGPSIEHEIVTQPNVVDLLISLCHLAASSHGKLEVFPVGLGLQVPPIWPLEADYPGAAGSRASKDKSAEFPPRPTGYNAKFNRATLELLFDSNDKCPVRAGDWIVFPKSDKSETDLHCRIGSTNYFPTVSVSEPIPSYSDIEKIRALTEQKASQTKQRKPETPAPTPSFESATFYLYDLNFDEANDVWKRAVIIQLLSVLPTVMEMRKYIVETSKELSSWVNRISPAAAGLLRWIIASSRACIFQVDDIDSAEGKKVTKAENRIHGMPGWMQFRFAMGAPDKERRFLQEAKKSAEKLKPKFPTIFAWHGSMLHNWHSIIREGLHYNYVASGRAFGDGVYMSPDFHTSVGYSNQYRSHPANALNLAWPQTRLNISSIVSLQEVVNAPQQFRSRSPHFVVQHIDWVQTRYLFVKCFNPEIKLDESKTAPIDVFHQDPTLTPKGETGARIVIPASAIPRSRKTDDVLSRNAPKLVATPLTSSFASSFGNVFGTAGTSADPITLDEAKKSKAVGTSADPIDLDIDMDDGASIATADEDREIFKEDSPPPCEPILPQGKGKSKASMTDFAPGTLDVSSLPILAPPSYATPGASKRLLSDFRTLVTVQDVTPLHELGWYINPDPDLMTNLFQWIVELHSFDPTLPLAKDMKAQKITSVVLELRFGKDFPHTPPFVRVIRPRFLGFNQGGGGHVTLGGAICMELLTNTGWTAVSSLESVLLQVRMAMSSTDPRPARLVPSSQNMDYGIGEAVEAYRRACQVHGWKMPPDLLETTQDAQASRF
ncbi:hypothetical protein NA57DRAFT_37473 [Rhizodiscina lignyota]|uniref:UBC core domain-containing protein n=1 Tax=Rhizodiscina lignyota TaxID=1504668 RepID=A0A9P4ID59_9PEZI|nr:hypothetical protein NA57DRAFT_37473 [Rhizodiscina lignyota]